SSSMRATWAAGPPKDVAPRRRKTQASSASDVGAAAATSAPGDVEHEVEGGVAGAALLLRAERVGPAGEGARAARLHPQLALAHEAQQDLVGEQERADLAGLGQLPLQARLPGDGVAVVDHVLAVHVDLLDVAVGVEEHQ